MTVRLLIEAIVKQTTVLLAEIATSGGLRAPLAKVADQVFVELTRELDAHGVSRSVSADMFGLALRTYLRKIRRHDESLTEKGSSLWEAVLRYVEERKVVSRKDVLERFSRDETAVVRGVLQDLVWCKPSYPPPARCERVTLYAGQCVIEESDEDES